MSNPERRWGPKPPPPGARTSSFVCTPGERAVMKQFLKALRSNWPVAMGQTFEWQGTKFEVKK